MNKAKTDPVIQYAEKDQMREIRTLWQEAFRDPEVYADYYFEQVYPGNQVVVAEEDGQILSMVHLNPYEWRFERCPEHSVWLHYIVGVATRQAYRRKGWMAACLNRALRDMEQAGEPFTYLMPAREEYYSPFGFVSIARQRIWEKSDRDHGWMRQEVAESKSSAGIPQLEMRNYPMRTGAYRKRLELEMKCDRGGLIEWENPYGYAAYGFEDDQQAGPIIMQIYTEENLSKGEPDANARIETEVCPILYDRYGNCRIRYVEKQPMMLRVLNLEAFVKLLTYRGESVIEDVQVVDPICSSNQGRFRICLSEQACTATRISETDGAGCRVQEIAKLTEELIKATDFADTLYIMEIV